MINDTCNKRNTPEKFSQPFDKLGKTTIKQSAVNNFWIT